MSITFCYAVLGRKKSFSKKTLENRLNTRPVNQLEDKQMRLKHNMLSVSSVIETDCENKQPKATVKCLNHLQTNYNL